MGETAEEAQEHRFRPDGPRRRAVLLDFPGSHLAQPQAFRV